MKSLRTSIFRALRAGAVGLATLGMLASPTHVLAGNNGTTVATDSVAHSVQVTDIAMSSGAVNGKVVDQQGTGLEGVEVVFRQGDREVASAVTDGEGAFTVRGLRPGVYQAVAAHGSHVFRIWAQGTAPPAARPTAVIVNDSRVVRGQEGGGCCCGLTLLDGLLIAGMTVAIVLAADAMEDVDDLENQLASP